MKTPAAYIPTAQPTVPTRLFPHQHQSYLELHTVTTTFFAQDWDQFPVRPRTNLLLIGSTGLGKTEIARTVASELELPFLEIVFNDWLPMGSGGGRGSTHTWPLILRFIERHDRGIIFVDEIDKSGDDNWNRHITMELFNLLDHKIAANILDEDVDDDEDLNKRRDELAAAQHKLRTGFLIVGAGAFQNLGEARARHLGFAEGETEKPIELQDLARVLPRELTNRFRGKIIHMPSLKREDYVRILNETAAKVPAEFRHTYRRLGNAGLDSALRNRQGVRFFEEIAIDAVIAAKKETARREVTIQELDCAA